MADFTLGEYMRTGHVKRWQIVRTAREQTLAEHLYRVWVITMHICEAIRTPNDINSVAAVWALIHDVPEVITGDIATPAKEAMRKALPHDDPVRNIELSLSDTYRDAYHGAKAHISPEWPSAYEIVKLADLIEAKCFLGCEMLGNHAKEVFDGMCEAVEQKFQELKIEYPNLEWDRIDRIINVESWRKV